MTRRDPDYVYTWRIQIFDQRTGEVKLDEVTYEAMVAGAQPVARLREELRSDS